MVLIIGGATAGLFLAEAADCRQLLVRCRYSSSTHLKHTTTVTSGIELPFKIKEAASSA
jgi:hypothetical protein